MVVSYKIIKKLFRLWNAPGVVWSVAGLFRIKIMKLLKSIFSGAILLLLIAGCKQDNRPKLVMATNAEFPPYEFIANQRIDGIDPEIIR